MKLDRTLENHYPNLSRWIKTEIPKCRYNARIFSAFMKYSQLDEPAAAAALAFNGLAPVIDVRPMPAYGRYSPYKYPNKIFLEKKMCRRYEKLGGDLAFNSNYDLILKATILHEMVHWGDYTTDGKRQLNAKVYDVVHQTWQVGDIGFQFESEAFYGIYTFKYLNL